MENKRRGTEELKRKEKAQEELEIWSGKYIKLHLVTLYKTA